MSDSRGRTTVGEVAVICSSRPPFKIRWASSGWLDVFGFTRTEVHTRDLRCISGAETDEAAAQAIVRSVKAQTPVSFTCVSFSRSGGQVCPARPLNLHGLCLQANVLRTGGPSCDYYSHVASWRQRTNAVSREQPNIRTPHISRRSRANVAVGQTTVHRSMPHETPSVWARQSCPFRARASDDAV